MGMVMVMVMVTVTAMGASDGGEAIFERNVWPIHTLHHRVSVAILALCPNIHEMIMKTMTMTMMVMVMVMVHTSLSKKSVHIFGLVTGFFFVEGSFRFRL